MFGYDNVRSQTVVLSDPGADGTFPIWKAPSRAAKVEILFARRVDTGIAGRHGDHTDAQTGRNGTATVSPHQAQRAPRQTAASRVVHDQ